MDNGQHTPLNTADCISVRVESTHVLLSADFELYIGDELQDSRRMGPGGFAEFVYEHIQPKTEPSKHIAIKVISSGGGFGTQQDAKLVLAGEGLNQSITLTC